MTASYFGSFFLAKYSPDQLLQECSRKALSIDTEGKIHLSQEIAQQIFSEKSKTEKLPTQFWDFIQTFASQESHKEHFIWAEVIKKRSDEPSSIPWKTPTKNVSPYISSATKNEHIRSINTAFVKESKLYAKNFNSLAIQWCVDSLKNLGLQDLEIVDFLFENKIINHMTDDLSQIPTILSPEYRKGNSLLSHPHYLIENLRNFKKFDDLNCRYEGRIGKKFDEKLNKEVAKIRANTAYFIGNRILFGDGASSVKCPTMVSLLLQKLDFINARDPYQFLQEFDIDLEGNVTVGQTEIAHVQTRPEDYETSQMLRPGDLLFTQTLSIQDIKKPVEFRIKRFLFHKLISAVQSITERSIGRNLQSMHAAVAIADKEKPNYIDIAEATKDGVIRFPSPQDPGIYGKKGTYQGRWKVYREPDQRFAKRTAKLAASIFGESGHESTKIGYNYTGVLTAPFHSSKLGSEGAKKRVLELAAAYKTNHKIDALFCSEFVGSVMQAAMYESILKELPEEIRKEFELPQNPEEISSWIKNLLQKDGLFDTHILPKLTVDTALDSRYLSPGTLSKSVDDRIQTYLHHRSMFSR